MQMYQVLKSVAVILLLLVSGCAVLESSFQRPSVEVVSVVPTASNGLEQQFNIGLKVSNPNSLALNLLSMTYAIEIDGFKVIRGAASDIPSIAANGEEIVTISAAIGFFEGLKFLKSLASKTKPELQYKLSADLDTGLPFIGVLPVTDSGVVNVSDYLDAS